MQTTQQRAYSYHKRKKKQECQRKKQRACKKRRNRQRQEGRNLMFRLQKTIDHHFPDLYEQIEAIPECRKRPEYSLLELIMAGVVMFLTFLSSPADLYRGRWAVSESELLSDLPGARLVVDCDAQRRQLTKRPEAGVGTASSETLPET